MVMARAGPVSYTHLDVYKRQFQFSFTNLTGASFTVFATTNLAAPFNTWLNLGPAMETPPGSGQFQFTDSQATNYMMDFYRVTSP